MRHNHIKEKIHRVRSKINGDEFWTSNLYEKTVDGIQFVGVFKQSPTGAAHQVNWMRKDNLTRIKE